MDAIEATTRMILRLEEAHRLDKDPSDLHVGIRLGLLTAMNIAIGVKADAEAELRLKAESR